MGTEDTLKVELVQFLELTGCGMWEKYKSHGCHQLHLKSCGCGKYRGRIGSSLLETSEIFI